MTEINSVSLTYPDSSTKKINIINVIEELYYKLAIISTKYTKKELEEIKIILSSSSKYIPLYDIFSKNFYIINTENVFNRISNFHYRLPDNDTIQRLKDTIKSIKNNTYKDYKEKLVKNINFIENFDLKTLQNNYYKHYYLSQATTLELTSCIKPSFIPFMTQKPYYTKSELINMGLNLNLDMTDDIGKLCSKVSDNDINANTILNHQMYIKNQAKSYVHFYTLLGSWYWNFYIRNECKRDTYVELQIEKLYNIIKNAPSFDKQYWVYRFVDNDDYLQGVKVGDIYEESSFISTTRNPFYDTKSHQFGFILIKILLPKDKNGTGLCLESYSLFPMEEEILLNPSKLKLIEKNEKFHYYHPNKNASNKIKTMYVFELVETMELKDTSHYDTLDEEISTIDWLRDSVNGNDFESKVYHFYHSILSTYNNKRYFYSYIGKRKYLFQGFYLDDNPVYEKYFFLQKKDNVHREEMYFILQDDDTGDIIMIIELRDVISVNYIHKFVGTPEQPFTNEEIITFLSSLGHYFSINQILIHDRYQSYNKISTKLLKNINHDIFDNFNPDNHVISLYSGDFNYFNLNLINYIEKKEKNFLNLPGITYNLKSHHFVRFEKIMAIAIFNDIEKSPLHNILIKVNKKKQHNLLEYYIYIHYNYFYLIKELNTLIINYDKDIFTDITKSPWINSTTMLDAEEYLYSKKMIPNIKVFKSNIYQNYLKKLGEEHHNISFSKYRLNIL